MTIPDIRDIYDAAKARGLARSQRQFSREYLGRAGNYACETGGLRACSAGALLHLLYRRLSEEGQVDLQAVAFACLLEAEARDGGARAVGR